MQQSDEELARAVRSYAGLRGCWRRWLLVPAIVVAVPIGAVVTLVVVYGIVATVAPEALRQWLAPSYSAATAGVRDLYDGSLFYYNTQQFDAANNPLPARFPQSSPLTPSQVPCGRVAANPALWSENPTWRALHFDLPEPHKYAFQYDSSGEGATAQFTASAFGDLDCDGVYSTFVRFGSVREGQVRGSAGLYIANELE